MKSKATASTFIILCLTMGLGLAKDMASAETSAPIRMPYLLAGEMKAFNWNPTYTVNLPAFDSRNYAFFRGRTENANDIPPFNLEHFNSRGLVKRPYEHAILRNFAEGTVIQKTMGASGRRHTSGSFNSSDEYFTLIGVVVKEPLRPKPEKAWILLWTADTGLTWSSYVIARQREFIHSTCPERYSYDGPCDFPDDVEIARNFSPSPVSGNMPAILMFKRTGKMTVTDTDFNEVGNLSLLLISRNAASGPVRSHRFIPLATRAMGIGSHSGGSARVIRFKHKVYVAWVSGTDTPAEGSPTVVAMYDVSTRTLEKKTVAYVRPANDNHNQPSMIMTSKGILHVITGAHGKIMRHTYTLKPGTIASWSNPTSMGSDEQTYLSMVTDSNDNIHAVYRRWITQKDTLGKDIVLGVLAYQKYNGVNWSAPKNLVYPNMSGYFIYYQHLTIDRRDNLYLSYSRWSTNSPYCAPSAYKKCATHLVPQFSRNSLLKSGNLGKEWHLATDRDIQKEVLRNR